MSTKQIRNIAIIAHVDHGKTTMVDQLLRQSGTFAEHEKVVDTVRSTTDRLQQALERDPAIARRGNVRALARFFAAEGHGLAVLARAGVRRQELEAAAEVALQLLEPGPPRR